MKIALIDKHPVLRKGLDKVLASNFDGAIIMESDTIIHFRELFPKQIPDLIIMGLGSAADAGNLDFINMSRRWYPKGSVIIYDEDVNLPMISRYLSTGARGYLSKAADLNELIECVKDVVSGKRYLSEEILLWVLNTYDFGNKKRPVVKGNGQLTDREQQIAEFLVDGMKTSWIARELGRKPSTISTIKNNIFKKLEINNVLKLRDVIKPVQVKG
ncbi:response regulator transcription factor [Dyadobacter sp. CY312]|uniref:response regulator transcription factor n=1 Tax=Dyadobacter sp. CY312 TaxID=2907303 RepID=UPI001F377CEB|nr:response regulator transcription factor [Dyadobacter sp. CY312]MCE7042801.1 response regulator transcription factor [Dyadobacter sp. CY312]